jgi:DNA polymerase-4
MVHDIAHLDIPDFYATLEELRRPELKKRPLTLSEGGPRAVIQGVNSLARSEGLREGMVLGQARRLCRRLTALPPDLRFYREQHRQVIEELGRFSPLVEGTFPGRYFVDLTGTKRLWGPGTDAACRVERHLADRRALVARVGLGGNKLVSQVAASCIPPGDLGFVFPGGEQSFLAPLPVTSLPGVGLKTSSKLYDFNIQQVGQLAELPVETLAGVFGKTGNRLLRLARGIDPTPVIPFQYVPRLSFTRHLGRDEIDRERLEAELFAQAEEVGWALRTHNRTPARFTLEVRYADGVTAQAQRPLSPITTHVDTRLFLAFLQTYRKLVQRRVAIHRMVVELSDFSMPLRQMSLFPWEEVSSQDDLRLQDALDRIRRQFGRGAIAWGRTVGRYTR